MTKIKNKNRGEAIKDHSNKLADHADAIGEVRKAIEKEVRERDETDDVFSQQFTELVEGITAKSKNDRLVRKLIFAGLNQLKKKTDYLRLPWWKRAYLSIRKETPWHKPEISFTKKELEALAAPIGEPSSTSSPTDAAEDSCTKSSDKSPTTPKKNTDTSNEGPSSSPSLPTTPPTSLESDSDAQESSRVASFPTGGRATPIDS